MNKNSVESGRIIKESNRNDIDLFMRGTDGLVTIDVAGKDPNYLRTQLNKRIEARTMEGIKVSVVNNVCYLEKT